MVSKYIHIALGIASSICAIIAIYLNRWDVAIYFEICRLELVLRDMQEEDEDESDM